MKAIEDMAPIEMLREAAAVVIRRNASGTNFVTVAAVLGQTRDPSLRQIADACLAIQYLLDAGRIVKEGAGPNALYRAKTAKGAA